MREVFVFGSNLSGRHGKGAALFAKMHYGAVRGVGEGMSGNAYAIPTKGHRFEVLPRRRVREGIVRFVQFATTMSNVRFLLTPIGTGLAGYDKHEIWSLLQEIGLPENVSLTASWVTDGPSVFEPSIAHLLS